MYKMDNADKKAVIKLQDDELQWILCNTVYIYDCIYKT